MSAVPAQTTTYRRNIIMRFMQYLQFILTCFLILLLVVAVFASHGNSACVVATIFIAAFVIVYLIYPSFYIAYRNKIVLSPEGIGYHYLGLSGFAPWEDIVCIENEQERAWLSIGAHSMEKQTSVQIGFIVLPITLRWKTVIGIRLKKTPILTKDYFARLPSQNLDFIPVSLILDVPRLEDETVNFSDLAFTEFGQGLKEFAPHLFDYANWPEQK